MQDMTFSIIQTDSVIVIPVGRVNLAFHCHLKITEIHGVISVGTCTKQCPFH